MSSFRLPKESADCEELFNAFLAAHESALQAAKIPKCKWRTLCKKLSYSVFDAGENFVYLEEDISETDGSQSTNKQRLKVHTKSEMSLQDTEHIYLIDHAWTYTLDTAQRTLEQNEALVQRMAAMMDVPTADISSSHLIQMILNKMWLFNNCYIAESGNQISPTIDCWFILDEFGSRILYSEEPSFELVSFSYYGDMYSLLFPKHLVSEGEEVTVAYIGYSSSLSNEEQKALMYPWSLCNLSDIDFELNEPPVDYFASGRGEDILPELTLDDEVSSIQSLEVYTEYPDVVEFLTHSSFKIVDEIKEAKILWLATRQYNISVLAENYPNFKFISQFPSEHVLINKDLLACVCRRASQTSFDVNSLESYPEWLPTTFNLKTELPKFVSYFQSRHKRNLDNVWICKPFNLARGIGIQVTDNLAQIIRLSQVRPMVACKYITDPVLFPLEERGLVKMDLRYIVLLRSITPLQLFLYDRFWLRFANKPFILSDFGDYETHFTVMNYSDFPLKQMFCQDFIKMFEDYYPSFKWSNIQETINTMIVDIFKSGTEKEAPAGIGSYSGSRAMYGLDIMLKWDRNKDVHEIKPMILEVNWMPDCKRACQYYPEFYDDVFSILFLGDSKDRHASQLL